MVTWVTQDAGIHCNSKVLAPCYLAYIRCIPKNEVSFYKINAFNGDIHNNLTVVIYSRIAGIGVNSIHIECAALILVPIITEGQLAGSVRKFCYSYAFIFVIDSIIQRICG